MRTNTFSADAQANAGTPCATILASEQEAEHVTLTAELELAAGEADSKKGPRAFSINAYGGGAIELAGFDLPVVVDLKGITAAKSIVANMHHDKTAIVGHVTERINDGRTLRLNGLASGAGAAAAEVLAAADNGFPWQASIEANQLKMVRVPLGKTVEVNGQSFDGPLLIARKSRLKGIAFVPHGADESTSVKIAAGAKSGFDSKKGDPMNFDQWIETLGLEASELSEKQRSLLKTKYEAEINASAKTGKVQDDDADNGVTVPEFDLDEVKAAAAEHMASLEAKFAEHEDDATDRKRFAEIKASAIKAARELKANAIKNRWAATRLEIETVRAIAAAELELVRSERPRGPAIHSSSRDLSGQVLEAAMCQSLNLNREQLEKDYDDKTLQAAHSEFRGRLGVQQLLIMAAAMNGHHLNPGERLSNGNLRGVLKAALSIEAAASTLSLPGILSNVANKEILTGYMEEDQIWREIADIKNVNDFKQVTSYRLLDSMEYEELGANGEIKHGTVGEESYTRQAKTYAKMFALKRGDIINDDLGAFDDLRVRLGRGASQKFNKIFWTAFVNNSSFFTSALTNYIEGATTTLLTDGVGLGLGVKQIRKMTSPSADGTKHVGAGVRPTILLVPPELEAAAELLYKATNLGSVKAADANIYANKYRPVVAWQLSDSSYTGYSTTAWYLFGDALKPMCVSFLNGVQTPTVESADADFDTLGVQFRGYHDFGCDKSEKLAGIKSKGAA